ncbi:MAG: response regulator [Bacteroidota bacterium]
MKIQDIKITTQLKLGFACILILVIVLGSIAYYQTNKIQMQVSLMYNHPLKVRRALSTLRIDVLKIQLEMKSLYLDSDEKKYSDHLHQIELCRAEVLDQLEILYSQYLGPRTDLDALKRAFISWNFSSDESIHHFQSDKRQEFLSTNKYSGSEDHDAEILASILQKIDVFAVNKSESLYIASGKLNAFMNRQLILLVISILLLSSLVIYFLQRNISQPVKLLIEAARRFHNGDLNARSTYSLNNEFGILSESFNSMAESVQISLELNEKAARITGQMLSQEEVKNFFVTTLAELSLVTGSQMAAAYLLSEDKKTFEHFSSTGMEQNAKHSFLAESFEGEFGAVLSQKKIQHLKDLPGETRFVFHTASGKYIPKEIITIPVLSGKMVVAVISLASINQFTEQAIQLLEKIIDALCARVVSVLSLRRILEFSIKLEAQNRELEAQKTEMAAQSSELSEQNIELEMQKKQLDEASQLKTNFLSNMSHELRTPLNSVIALTGVLNRRLAKKIPDEEYSYLEVIERNGKNLLALINDILDISRIEAGHEEIEVTKFNPYDVIYEILGMLKVQAQQKGVMLKHSDRDDEMILKSDVGKCRHILQNLISNALKFTDSGTVEVIARKNSEFFHIDVTDTGIGISENQLPYIFEEFRQADSSTSKRFGGTGLGLTIAQKYANLLGGSISVKSTEGKGSEFSLKLPLSIDLSKSKTSDQTFKRMSHAVHQIIPNPPVRLSDKTVLLVEDSEPAIIQMKDILEDSGFNILVAHDGAEALAIINRVIPDAMILDLMMPGIDGFQVLKTIRDVEKTSHIPVLILTAKHITKDELSFLTRNNVHQLIRKGDVNRMELLQAIETMVSHEPEVKTQGKRETPKINGIPKILVVEDNPDNMITIKALLMDHYTILEAIDGNNSIEVAMENNPDLILMDIALPGMDGKQAFEMIRANPQMQHIPVIALTASAMTNDREKIMAWGFDAYIAKPIEEKNFYQTIKETLYGS